MPQNQKTDVLPDIDPDNLPDLTAQQFEFVTQIMSGAHQSDAYRAAYNVGENTLATTVHAEASRLRANPNVAAWISALKRQQFARGVYTKEMHLAELDALAEEAKASGNYGAAVNACKAKGQVEGHYVSLHEDVGKRSRSPAEMIEQIEKDLGSDIADKYAEKLGVKRMRKTG